MGNQIKQNSQLLVSMLHFVVHSLQEVLKMNACVGDCAYPSTHFSLDFN